MARGKGSAPTGARGCIDLRLRRVGATSPTGPQPNDKAWATLRGRTSKGAAPQLPAKPQRASVQL
ncbi:hypothetical protein EDD92_2614 [Streptomyces sp. TLI_185]|nr:hypothetical protein EDD92_2614 [Streptomyces sp. TLI_185]